MLYFFQMETEKDLYNLRNYHSTKRIEYPLTDEWTQIRLAFPSLTEVSWSRVKGHCLKIDHCYIKYSPQVPANAEGTVLVTVHDRRMENDKSLQAEYTFPIRCGIELNFFSSSYFSLKDPVPWTVYYRVINSTVLKGSHFCQFKASVKLSASKSSTNIKFRSPSVKVLNSEFTSDHVDFMHVGIPKPERVLCRSTSCIISQPRMALEAGTSWASRSMIGGDDGSDAGSHVGVGPYKGLMGLNESAIDPGDSVSQVNSGHRKSISDVNISKDKLAEIVAEAALRGSQIGLQLHEESSSKGGERNSGFKKK